jgi:hypothetical protein
VTRGRLWGRVRGGVDAGPGGAAGHRAVRGPVHGTDGVQPGQTRPDGDPDRLSSTCAPTRRNPPWESPWQPVDNPCSAQAAAVSVLPPVLPQRTFRPVA